MHYIIGINTKQTNKNEADLLRFLKLYIELKERYSYLSDEDKNTCKEVYDIFDVEEIREVAGHQFTPRTDAQGNEKETITCTNLSLNTVDLLYSKIDNSYMLDQAIFNGHYSRELLSIIGNLLPKEA